MTIITETPPVTGRRETPTSHLVLSIDAPRTEWLEARRNGVTATDLPAIMGLSKYRNAIDVWNDKILPVVDNEAGEAAFWGTKLEGPVAQAWADLHDVKIRRIGIVANQDCSWALASLDRLVHGCPNGRCALEVKTRNLYVSEEWQTALPDDVRTQVMWQLAVTGLDHIHVAALIGGQRLVEHVVLPDANEIARLRDAAALIWDAVQARVMPDLPATLWTSDYLDARHAERQGEIELEGDARDVIDTYENAGAMEKRYAEEKAAARTQLVGLLADCEVATIGGRIAYTFTASTARKLNAKKLREKYPDIESDDEVHNVTTTRSISIKKAAK